MTIEFDGQNNKLGTTTADSVTIKTNDTDALTVHSSGNVLIGTSDVTTDLGYNKKLKVSGTGPALYLEETDSGQDWSISALGGNFVIRDATSPSPIFFIEGGQTSESMRIDNSGNLKFNSGYGSVATAYGCRAWVNFNGSSTVAIRDSGNVSSITDNGTGNYTVNFATAMPDANYSAPAASGGGSAINSFCSIQNTFSTTAVQYQSKDFGGTLRDATFVCVAIFR